jgi:hypothetical protein
MVQFAKPLNLVFIPLALTCTEKNPGLIDPVQAVTSLLKEMAKYPPALFVSMKLHGMMFPAESLAVRTPTVAPVGALAATVKLLIVIVMDLSAAIGPQTTSGGPS